MRLPKRYALDYVPEERKWMISRFVEQKKKEHEEIERARKKAGKGK